MTTLQLQDQVRIRHWVTVDYARLYWETVNAATLELCKQRIFRVTRFDDDGLTGLYARVASADNQHEFWIKTCLLTLASDPELV
jgi:hypothetical protein